MIERAVAFAVQCRDQANAVPQITVNLAEASLRDDGLPDRVAALLDAHDLPARQLMFEITEREFLDPASAQSEVLGQLSELGVELTIDDFGTGWSSLDTLRWFPLSQLKIDGGFVDHIADHAADRIIVDKVIELAHLLHLLVVGEGIECVEQLEILRGLGCDRGQGFLFSPAVQADEALGFAAAGVIDNVTNGESIPSAIAPTGLESSSGAATSFRIESDVDCIDDAINDPSTVGSLGLQVLDVLPMAMFIKSIDGRIVWSNESHWRRVGVSSLAEVVELRDGDLHPIDEALRYRYDDLVVVTTGQAAIDRHEPQTRRDGSLRMLRTSKFPVCNRTGAVIGLIGFYVEVGDEGVQEVERDLARLSMS